MGVDRRSKMGLKRYLNPSDRFKVILVEHFLLPFKFCYVTSAILVVLVGGAYFEENRIVGKLNLCLRLFKRSAALLISPQKIV
jgi:hypothetical protein